MELSATQCCDGGVIEQVPKGPGWTFLKAKILLLVMHTRFLEMGWYRVLLRYLALV